MSAAEKLEALDDLDAFDLADTVRRALPEIIAVVKAAENPHLFDYDDAGERGYDRLVTALAALHGALELRSIQ